MRPQRFLFSILFDWFLVFSTSSYVPPPSPLLFIFSLCSSFPPEPLPPPPFLQPLQLLAGLIVFLLFLFLSPPLSQPRLFKYSSFFFFQRLPPFLFICLSPSLLASPPPVGKSLSLFSVLTNHCSWTHFFNLV